MIPLDNPSGCLHVGRYQKRRPARWKIVVPALVVLVIFYLSICP